MFSWLLLTAKIDLGADERGGQAKHGEPGKGGDGGLGAKYLYQL